ncbi:MAG: class I SAM-dependent methyltransferase [Candidatus Krumholzibacteria bacterium]
MAPRRTAITSTGALDGKVRLDDQLRPDIDYDRPRGGGDALFDLVGDLAGARILDLGCGLAPFRSRLEDKGARWVGLELDGPACSVIGDGDRLPFSDDAFDGVLCSAVLEHLPEPDRTMAEIRRVLRHGGKLFGYSSFLEPFHGMSYYHMSHMGLEYLLMKHGFRPTHIFPSHNGTAYQLECMLFPKHVPVMQPLFRKLAQWSFANVLAANRLARRIAHGVLGKAGSRDPENHRQYGRLLSLRFAVGFNFIAERGTLPDNLPSGYSALIKEG